jgi:hypothetical protein
MRMTSRTLQTDATRHGARVILFALLAAVAATGCGGGKDDDAVARTGKAGTDAAEAATGSPAVPPAGASEKQSRLAQAVADGKTTAPVDMKYDVLSKPAVGQPFEVELAFEPRLPADTLDIEVTEAPGLVLVGEKTARFAPVEAGQTYTAKVLVQGDSPGLFYVGVVAKMSTQVQTESRAFALPLVIGEPQAAEKPAPATDATGQAIQSLPAQTQQ